MMIRCYFDFRFEGTTDKNNEHLIKGTSVFSYENDLLNNWYEILRDKVDNKCKYDYSEPYEHWYRTYVEITNVREINEKYLTPDDDICYIYEL